MKLKKKVKTSKAQTSYIAGIFPPTNRPVFTDSLKFPDNITSIPTVEVSELLGKYTSMYCYANAELSKLCVEGLRLQSAITEARRQRLAQFMGTKVPKWEIDVKVDSGLKLVELREKNVTLEVRKGLIHAYLQNFEKYTQALSRELSRRASERA